MKICAYVQNAYAKQTYKNECLDARGFVGLRVVIDALNRAGYEVDWAGPATVNRYDIVLASLTADCDWWSFISERLAWPKGNYKVLIGGAGVLHVTPFLPFADYFTLGRGEETVVNLVRKLDGKPGEPDNSVLESATFSPEKKYWIKQTEQTYPHTVALGGKGKPYNENEIGCNHKCLFCGYTWHRKFLSPHADYRMGGGMFAGMEDKERAMLDIQRDPDSVDFSKLRTTAIDGMSERLRYMVNKRISRQMVIDFTRRMIDSDAKPHQIKYFNIVGYPTETFEDWLEFKETLAEADNSPRKGDKQWAVVLHNTPFRGYACDSAGLRTDGEKKF